MNKEIRNIKLGDLERINRKGFTQLYYNYHGHKLKFFSKYVRRNTHIHDSINDYIENMKESVIFISYEDKRIIVYNCHLYINDLTYPVSYNPHSITYYKYMKGKTLSTGFDNDKIHKLFDKMYVYNYKGFKLILFDKNLCKELGFYENLDSMIINNRLYVTIETQEYRYEIWYTVTIHNRDEIDDLGIHKSYTTINNKVYYKM